MTTALFLCLTILTAEGPLWPAFLGAGAPQPAADQLPLTWSPQEHVAWRADVMGHGQSSPVIFGSHVYLTSVDGPKKDQYHIACLDLASGKELWHKTLANSAPVENSVYVSRAAPTPVLDTTRVICAFESGDVVAYSHTGEQLWSRKLMDEIGALKAEFGLAASPCQTDQHVFILLEHDGPSALLALDKSTGQTAWKADRQPRRSWTSPAIISVEGKPQVVVSSAGSIDGYEPTSGKLLWSFEDVGGNTGTTPIDCGQGRFLVGAGAGRQGENAAEAKKSNCMMQIQRDGEQWKLARIWVAEDVSPSWGSPILHQGYAYWVNRVGVVTCLDAQSGKPVYTQRTKQSCWATPYAVGERVYFFGKEGFCTVLAAGPEFKVLATNETWEPGQLKPEPNYAASTSTAERAQGAAMFSGPTLYGVAVATDRFIVRIGNQAMCIAK